jgi:hypothetical protein
LVILCDQIKRQLEDIRDFFQSCGCSLSPTTFQVGNVALPDVSLVGEVELPLSVRSGLLFNLAYCNFDRIIARSRRSVLIDMTLA